MAISIQRQLLKAQTDAYSAIYLHKEKIRKLDRLLTLVDIFAVCVPVGFFGILLASLKYPKTAAFLADTVNPLLSAILLIFVLLTFVTHARPRLKQHQNLLSEETVLNRQIQEMRSADQIVDKDANRLLDWASRLDAEESQIFTKIGDTHRQEVYREALKSFGDIDIVCPQCGTSPFNFVKSKENICQVCGNALLINIKEKKE